MTTYIEDEPPGLLVWLQSWYATQCDGEWEHGYGVQIDTLDNPGWTLKVDLRGAGLDEKPFERVRVERDEHDWVHAWVEDATFQAACGPTNLGEALYIFRTWVSV